VSYILDALRKAERDRGLAKVPTLATVHLPARRARRRLWPWVAGAVVVANAAALAWLMSSTRAPELSARPGQELTRSAPAPVTPAPVAPPAQPVQASRAEPEKAAADVQPEGERRRAAADMRPEGTTRPPAAAVRSEAEIHPPTAPATVAEAAPPRQAEAPSVQVPPKRASAAVRQSPGRVSSSGPQASVAEKAAAPPSAVASEIRAKISLQLVVYSETPSERIVFINNQKFVEGQSIDGTVTVERIMPDGVVLTSQGERVVLRAEGAGRP
jgi:general secretion pathway protein B